MTPTKTQKSIYRHRGYECQVCHVQTMVFGGDAPPANCPSCGAVWAGVDTPLLQWDHTVTESVTVTNTEIPPK